MFIKSVLQILRNYKYLLILYLSIALLLIASSLFELRQSKRELIELMRSQAESTLNSLIMASESVLKSNAHSQQILKHQIADILGVFSTAHRFRLLRNGFFDSLASTVGAEGILILDPDLKITKKYGSFQNFDDNDLNRILMRIQNLHTLGGDTIIWKRTSPIGSSHWHYFGALVTPRANTVVIDIDWAHIKPLSQSVGFGHLVRQLAEENPSIVYLALQDSFTIVSAAGKVQLLEPVSQSKFLQNVFVRKTFDYRIIDFDTLSVFEAVRSFYYENNLVGIFRLGLSIEPLKNINDRIYRRLIIITFILIFIASIMLTFIFIRQRYDLLKRQFTVVETYSSNIIENVSDAILVFNNRSGIQIFNRAAEQLFKKNKTEVLNHSVEALFEIDFCLDLKKADHEIRQIECTIAGRHKILLISKSSFFDGDERLNFILVIRDVTDQKRMEDRLKRQEQLTAMGQLAAGVAHEIRNPLNSISTIVQQLRKDFTPKEEHDIYQELTAIVYNEVKRINEKINEFLRFSRPDPLRPQKFYLQKWLKDIIRQYEALLKEKSITLKLRFNWDGEVLWDANQIRQVLINLIQNAVDAMDKGGSLTIEIRKEGEEIILEIEDSGKGIPEENLEKIFNLYFTTKAHGTGIGLSMVQRIVFEHEGTISVQSKTGEGTRFTIRLPQEVKISGKQGVSV